MVDLLIDDASEANWCRAMAWRRQPQGALRKWEGIRVSYELSLDLAAIAAAGMPLESIRRVYSVAPPRRLVHFFSFPDGELLTDPEQIRLLSLPFDVRNPEPENQS